MSDIKLFSITQQGVVELEPGSYTVERSLQTLIERNSEAFLGVRLLASEYSTGRTHGGRIDSLGVDENGYPIIIEYKRAANENVINQGLYYLDWLLDHKGEFELLVQRRLGRDVADTIEWSNPRLLCIAADFTRYDEHAVQQIGRNIELLRYRRFGENLVMLELIDAPTVETEGSVPAPSNRSYPTAEHLLAQSSAALRDRFEALKAFLMALGDDVQFKQLKYYYAFKRIKNFACVEARPQMNVLLVYVKVDPATVELEEGFTRDVSNIGHYGTGDLEIVLRRDDDMKRAESLLIKSYQSS